MGGSDTPLPLQHASFSTYQILRIAPLHHNSVWFCWNHADVRRCTAEDAPPHNLEELIDKFGDREALNLELRAWFEEMLSAKADSNALNGTVFQLEELRELDYALEGLRFEQVRRMPCNNRFDWCSGSDIRLAVEDFLHSALRGVWKRFWGTKDDDICPFSIVFGNELNRDCSKDFRCAALVAEGDGKVWWNNISGLFLIKEGTEDNQCGHFPAPNMLNQAVYFALHVLFARKMAQINSNTVTKINFDTVYVLFIQSHGGGVVRMKADVSDLEINTTNIYQSVAKWVQQHAHLAVSTIEQVWNGFGNVDWQDVGALKLILAIFYSIEQCMGSPEVSISSMASRQLQCIHQRMKELGASKGDAQATTDQCHIPNFNEIEAALSCPLDLMEQGCVDITIGTVLWLEDCEKRRGYRISENHADKGQFIFRATAFDDQDGELLNIYVGANPTQLEPSWEDMKMWYQVQRQARVLNFMKERGLTNKYFPKLVDSGKLLHPGTCSKRNSNGHCNHPLCGVHILVTFPVGDSLDKIFRNNGVLTPKELLKCCHDCLISLQRAHLVGIHHANITPDHILCVSENGETHYVLADWGYAILEEKDRPPISFRYSATDVLQEGKAYPVSDVESLVYVLYFLCGGIAPDFENIDSCLSWRARAWDRRAIQEVLGEATIVLKAFADYVINLCGTPYAVDFGLWLNRIGRALQLQAPNEQV